MVSAVLTALCGFHVQLGLSPFGPRWVQVFPDPTIWRIYARYTWPVAFVLVALIICAIGRRGSAKFARSVQLGAAGAIVGGGIGGVAGVHLTIAAVLLMGKATGVVPYSPSVAGYAATIGWFVGALLGASVLASRHKDARIWARGLAAFAGAAGFMFGIYYVNRVYPALGDELELLLQRVPLLVQTVPPELVTYPLFGAVSAALLIVTAPVLVHATVVVTSLAKRLILAIDRWCPELPRLAEPSQRRHWTKTLRVTILGAMIGSTALLLYGREAAGAMPVIVYGGLVGAVFGWWVRRALFRRRGLVGGLLGLGIGLLSLNVGGRIWAFAETCGNPNLWLATTILANPMLAPIPAYVFGPWLIALALAGVSLALIPLPLAAIGLAWRWGVDRAAQEPERAPELPPSPMSRAAIVE